MNPLARGCRCAGYFALRGRRIERFPGARADTTRQRLDAFLPQVTIITAADAAELEARYAL